MFKKVLVPVDLGEARFSHQALTLALREVRENDAELHLITIVPGFTNALVASFFSEKDHQKAVKDVARKFKQYAEMAIPADVEPVLRVYEGSPADTIVDYIARKDIDLVVMSAHHRSAVGEFILGSVSARVAERSKCSIMLLKN